MSTAVFYNSYKLKKGVAVPDFLTAIDKLSKQIAKGKGHVSTTLLCEGDKWADYSVWETMDDLRAFLDAAQANPTDLAKEFYSFLNLSGCISRVYTVENSW